jgi:hypothetical protein
MQLTGVVLHVALQRIDRDMLHIGNKQYDVTRGANPLQSALGSLARRYISRLICRYDNNDTASRSHVPRGSVANSMVMRATD